MKLTASLPFNDIKTCRGTLLKEQDDIAAVLLSPSLETSALSPQTQSF